MFETKVGDRVVAFVCSDDESVNVIGAGVYAGDEEPPMGSTGFAGAFRALGVEAPRINLDSGEVVYGIECYWVTEALFQEIADGKQMRVVTIAEHRAAAPPLRDIFGYCSQKAREAMAADRPDLPPAVVQAIEDAREAAAEMTKPAIVMGVFEANNWKAGGDIKANFFSSAPRREDHELLTMGMRVFLEAEAHRCEPQDEAVH